ncbi:M48 family metalloprotease [Candidatus Berkiella cookevillensis]|uniref:M48 family metalloprotease n=1 Tax=Candidatus Berkiella cookevillensis TaxID=437022 RepID=A0A0Q9YA39_9GAMM|nr:M48 family metalloprotease [Candidatus Berkiella cookevillensis]MCS5707381.1 M48 family metalloprotease [Candidatus Berkiella cookevillensis]
MKNLEKKTKITVKDKTVCEVDESFAPNAAAAGGFNEQKIYVFSNILKAPFTRKEKKAIYAHEFGHLKHKDFLAGSASRFLYWTTAIFALNAFSLPVALFSIFAANIAYYAISQVDELLADWHCAQYANPKALGSALDKIVNIAEQIKDNKPKKEKGLLDTPKSYLNSFKRKAGMYSHPSVAVRKSYLDTYDAEKQLLKKSRAHRPRPTAAAA